MAEHDDVVTRLEERRAEIRAKVEARAKAAQELRLERIANAKALAQAKLEAKARARAEAEERAQARAAAQAEAKTIEETKARERAELRARAHAEAKAAEEAKSEARAAAYRAAKDEARARAEAKSRATTTAEPAAADLTGKQRLIDAAMRLHGEKRSFASLGIREIAREANLNPNTFYRHFESIDDLAVDAVVQCGERLRPMLHQIHRLASRVDPVSVAALEVSAFYAFALGNPDAFVVGVTEYHSGSQRVRDSIGGLLVEVSDQLRDDVTELGILPTITRENLDMACRQIVVHLFHLSQDYIEKPDQRDYIIASSESMIVWLFAGASLGTPSNFASPNRLLNPEPAP